MQRQQKTITSLQQLLELNTSILKAACVSGSIYFGYLSTNSLPITLILQFRALCAGNCLPDQDSHISAIRSERLTWIRNLHCLCYRCAQCSREDTLLAGDSRGLKMFAGLWNTGTSNSSTMDGKAAVVPRELKSLHLVLLPVLAQLQTTVIWTGFSFMKESMKLIGGMSKKLLEMAFVLGKIWYFCLIHGHFGIISLYPECISLYLEYLSPHTSIHCSG